MASSEFLIVLFENMTCNKSGSDKGLKLKQIEDVDILFKFNTIQT